MMIGTALFMYLFGGYLVIKVGEIFSRGFVFDRKDIFDAKLLPYTFWNPCIGKYLGSFADFCVDNHYCVRRRWITWAVITYL